MHAVEYDLLTFAAAKEGGELLLTPDDRMSPEMELSLI